MKRTLVLFMLLTPGGPALAQQATVDSLAVLLKTEIADTTRARLMANYSYVLTGVDPERGREAGLESLALSRALGLSILQARSYANIAGAYYYQGQNEDAEVWADSAVALAAESGDPGVHAFALNAKQVVVMAKGRVPEGLELGFLIIDLARQAGDDRRVMIATMNLGETYYQVGDYSRALKYSLDAIASADSIGTQDAARMKAYGLMRAGLTRHELGQFEEGAREIGEAVAIREALGEASQLPNSLSALAEVQVALGRYEEAHDALTRASELLDGKRDAYNASWVWLGWSRFFMATRKPEEAEPAARRALSFGRETSNAEVIHDALEILHPIYAERGASHRAYEHLVEFMAYEDSLTGESQTRAFQRIETERREQEAVAAREALVQAEQLRRNKLYAGLGGLGLFLLVGLVYAAKLRRKNQTIHQQKENVELLSQVGREITSSLHVEDILETTYSRVNALMDASVFGIGLVSEGGKTIDFAGTKEKGVTLPDHSDALDDPNRLAAYCFNKQEEVILNDFAADHQRYIVQKVKPVEGETSESIIYLPLTHQGKKLGVLTVQSFKKGSYGDYEVNILRNVATYTALALDNAEAYRQNEKLLLNILPGPIASRLKNGEETIADAFAEVTVLFADLVGFTTFASTTDADQVVFLLNELFSAFDSLTQQLGIEKIKTIGDAYLAVAGLPDNRPDHAEVMAIFALRMQDALAAFNQKNGLDLRLRIGLNTGPVVAGVIGTHKFVYDLWGDAVNVAARMESHGVAGRAQCSQTTFDALEGTYTFEDRGTIEIKGKGSMEAYLLSGPVGGLVAA